MSDEAHEHGHAEGPISEVEVHVAGRADPAIAIPAFVAARNSGAQAKCRVLNCANDRKPGLPYCEDHNPLFVEADSKKKKGRPKAKPIDNLLKELSEAWGAAKTLVYKDLPRLARRINVTSESRGKLVELGKAVNEEVAALTRANNAAAQHRRATLGDDDEEAFAAGAADGADISNWEAVSNCITAVALEVERPDKQTRVNAALAAVTAAPVSLQPGLEPAVNALFSNYVGTYSRTFRVFMAIHQEIISPTIFYLCKKLYNAPPVSVALMKDCRRPDSWVIDVNVGEESIIVTHRRWEMSPTAENAPDCFKVRWQLELEFDCGMVHMLSCRLTIIDCEFSTTMPPDRAAELRQALESYAGYSQRDELHEERDEHKPDKKDPARRSLMEMIPSIRSAARTPILDSHK